MSVNAATRDAIYRRLKLICEMHKAEKQHNEARCFMVGREYELNLNNLSKGDIQAGALQMPEFFYSEAWSERGKAQGAICADYPLVFLTPGERTPLDKNRSQYDFLMIVFDLMNLDRNNFAGNATALREKERIWTDTELIARQILEAFGDDDPEQLWNQCNAGIELGLPADPATWTPAQELQANEFLDGFLLGNFRVNYREAFSPFEHRHNDHLAGVAVEWRTIISHGCPDGIFVKRLCP